jgi:hypothetical protein
MMGGRLFPPGAFDAASSPPPQAASVSVEIASNTTCLPQLRIFGPIHCLICIPKRCVAAIKG